MRNDAAIVIVGAGPAGVSTWLHLHELAPNLAAHTVVIDKYSFPRDKICAGGITPLGDQVLKKLKSYIAVPTTVIQRMIIRCNDTTFNFHTPGAFRVVSRRAFDHSLLEVALSRGMCFLANESLVDLAACANYVMIATNRQRLRTAVVVGADGAGSLVRRRSFPSDRHQIALGVEAQVTASEFARSESDCAVIDFSVMKRGVPGYIWKFPPPDNCSGAGTIGIYSLPRAPVLSGSGTLRSLLTNACLEYGATSNYRVLGSPIRPYFMDQPLCANRVLLVGDAAGVDGFTGEGIAYALAYGRFAAEALVDAFKHDVFTFSSYRRHLLANYIGLGLLTRSLLGRAFYSARFPSLQQRFFTAVRTWARFATLWQ